MYGSDRGIVLYICIKERNMLASFCNNACLLLEPLFTKEYVLL
jgi:hypothetical protein